MTTPPRMYIHFRSPYSWLASERIGRDGLIVDPIAFTGVPDSLNPNKKEDPAVAARLAYMREDVTRIARLDLGLEPVWSNTHDIDWTKPALALHAAKKAGQGTAFMVAAFHARYTTGADISDPGVIGGIAESVSLDPAEIIRALDDTALEREYKMSLAPAREDRVCGVPFFVYDGQHFWGQDRYEYLKRAMAT